MVPKIFGLILAAMLLTFSACDGGSGKVRADGGESEAKTPKIKVVIVEVKPGTIRDVLILPGETKPWKDVALAADQAGRVDWVGPKEGDRVKKDEIIVKIDVAAMKAGLDNARANLNLAEDHFRRRKELFERKIISLEELDQSRNQLKISEGMVRQMKVNFENGFVRSPIDGVVNRMYVDPGEFVGQGGPVADVVNVDQVEINVNVPEMDVRWLKAGDPALVTVDALPDLKVLGKIDFVAFKADPSTRTFRVKVLVDNAKGAIRPGMISRVFFQKQLIADAMVAPLSALVERGGERLLYVEEDGVARARTISFGVIEGDKIQITEGLKSGDHLIVTGQNNVQEGTAVQVVQ